MTKPYISLLVACMALCGSLTADAARHGFAIFVDSISHSRVSAELDAYARSVDRQGLISEIVVVTPQVTPDSLRSVIRTMASRKQSPIEGMVFVGDIPIPMLLDTQHFTSAFKVVQNMKRPERSACPSDRFYDDLSLKFDFVSRDDKKPLLYYYSLRPDSPQQCAPTLYSGRIKSMDFYGKDRYENLRDYLRKVVRVKERAERLDRMFLFSGSGYNSESPIARQDEKMSFMEQFPWMRRQASSLDYLDHKHTTFAKYTLMSYMQQPDLSLALLHHHGSPVKEYINRYPDTRSTRDQLEGAKSFFRSKIRNAVESGTPLDSACAYYVREYDVPRHWFDTVMDSASIAADSVYNERLDLHLHDFDRYRPNARVVMLDACFNGSFNNDVYLAGAYVFGEGDCVSVIANSVNSLQDKWCDKSIGMLGLGMRVGNMVKYNPYLESHILGDPTFAFAPADDRLGFDINTALVEAPASFWKKQLRSPYPAMQAMAMEKLTDMQAITPGQLLDIFTSSPFGVTRFAALMNLSESPGSPEFVESLRLGLNDSYELVRRFSAILAGKNGSPQLIPAVIAAYANSLKGERVNFQLQNAMQLFDYRSLIDELESQRPYRHSYDEAEMMTQARNNIADRFSSKRYDADIERLASDNPDMREVKSFVRQLRNNPLHPSADKLLAYLDKCPDEALSVSLAEALGWFDYSYRAPEIARRLAEVAADPARPRRLRDEAAKSVARLKK